MSQHWIQTHAVLAPGTPDLTQAEPTEENGRQNGSPRGVRFSPKFDSEIIHVRGEFSESPFFFHAILGNFEG